MVVLATPAYMLQVSISVQTVTPNLDCDQPQAILSLSDKSCVAVLQAEDVKPEIAALTPPGGKGVGKDPTVPTDFLPDRERERREEDLRHQLKTEFQLRQQVAPEAACACMRIA